MDDHDMTAPTTDRRPSRRRRRAAVAAVAVAALAGGWALSDQSPAAQAAGDRAGAVSERLEAATATAGQATADSLSRTRPPKNTAPKDEAFQRHIDALVTEDGFPGVEAFVRGADGTVRSYTAGVGNLETKAPVPADGQVRIASNTKTVTAVAVLQLVGEGKIDLDAPVETYLPGVVRGRGGDGNAITVRQLLQHTSGLPDFAGAVYAQGLPDLAHTYFEPRQSLDTALSQPAAFAPGTSWGYSNTNYLLAGLIVQRVTGRPIGEEITKRVIEPAALDHTYWPGTGEQTIRGEHPRGYSFAEPGTQPVAGAEPVDVTDQDTSLPWAAGALVSTPSDLSAFSRALLGGTLLEPAQQEELLSTVSAPGFEPEDDGWSYGLGFAQKELECGVSAWGHGGDISGYETRNLTTEDGRSAVVTVTSLPISLEGLEHVNATVENAICGS